MGRFRWPVARSSWMAVVALPALAGAEEPAREPFVRTQDVVRAADHLAVALVGLTLAVIVAILFGGWLAWRTSRRLAETRDALESLRAETARQRPHREAEGDPGTGWEREPDWWRQDDPGRS